MLSNFGWMLLKLALASILRKTGYFITFLGILAAIIDKILALEIILIGMAICLVGWILTIRLIMEE